ncbi:MAG: hypothetical protein H8E41_11015 [Desulfobulbaceae bacterium]|uniref:Uncharacterized protein n=1 Tax=Candidatus Desulfobia pelagia TaxID=2841692 RepID=A0A8J6TD89_9BACT|nr:hypothetical protein [Candidatus Desulfobia pelagia]
MGSIKDCFMVYIPPFFVEGLDAACGVVATLSPNILTASQALFAPNNDT